MGYGHHRHHHHHRRSYSPRHESRSRLQVFHNVAGGPKVNAFVDGNQVLSNVPYKGASGYLLLPSGRHTVTVIPVNSRDVLTEVTVNLRPSTSYTAIVHGALSEGEIDTLLLQDNIGCPEEGKSHVRFVHAAATVPAVDVYANGNIIFENVSYGQTGEPVYLPVDSNLYLVQVTPAGSRDVVFQTELVLENGGIYSVIASGLLDNPMTPITALVSEDSSGMCVLGY